MSIVRAKDLKKLLENIPDEDVIVFRIFDESKPKHPLFASDIADSATLSGVRKHSQQTSSGDADVFRIDLSLDVDL
ncbi:hypothetical protein [Pseudomonas sp. CFBP 13719]|uniref:hypothetical protein n=1 Tax=Pseudomonas sp. CFBP 13719 TaxID=2775303 RepID=UPI0017830DB8|nr:hypothetical protein [Pseudomonas sp. CFBP 13719]MBD8681633.1 hypothetical protein [Pseudomonas sp. CFBP 13719]